MRPVHRMGAGAILVLCAIAAILLFGPPWVRAPVLPPADEIGSPLNQRIAQAILGSAPYVERRSECELLNSGYGLPFCDSYGPDYALYPPERIPEFAAYEDYDVNSYSRGYGVEGRGWQLP